MTLKEVTMKTRITLLMSVFFLLGSMAFAAGPKVDVFPTNALVFAQPDAGQHSVELDGLCSNDDPCNLTWTAILSDSQVGSITNKSGPVTTFNAGQKPGWAEIFVSDGKGNVANVTITVQK
jgi:hypothetical protein